MGNDLYVKKDMKYLVNEFITEQENEDKLTNEMVDLVLEALGVENMENALDVMKDLMSEFITEQENEDKLNNEIDDLLDGIDFSQPMDDIDCTQFEVSISFVLLIKVFTSHLLNNYSKSLHTFHLDNGSTRRCTCQHFRRNVKYNTNSTTFYIYRRKRFTFCSIF